LVSKKETIRESHLFPLEENLSWGWITNPRKAASNRAYSRTTRGRLVVVLLWAAGVTGALVATAAVFH
jgi:hypothetical protein